MHLVSLALQGGTHHGADVRFVVDDQNPRRPARFDDCAGFSFSEHSLQGFGVPGPARSNAKKFPPRLVCCAPGANAMFIGLPGPPKVTGFSI